MANMPLTNPFQNVAGPGGGMPPQGMSPDNYESNPFLGIDNAQAQGGGSMPSTPPSPPAPQATGIPAPQAGGVSPPAAPAPMQQPDAVQQLTQPSATDPSPDDLLQQLEAGERGSGGDGGGGTPTLSSGSKQVDPDPDDLMSQLEQGEQQQQGSGKTDAHNLGGGMWERASELLGTIGDVFSQSGTPIGAGMKAGIAGMGAIANVANGGTLHDAFVQAGQDLMSKGTNIGTTRLKDALSAAGIDVNPDPGTASNIGRNVVDASLQTMALAAAAPAMAARVAGANGSSTLQLAKDYFIKSVGEAAQKNPWIGLVYDAVGSAGATVGQERHGLPGAVIGGTLASVAATPGVWAASKGIKISQSLLGQVAEQFDNFASKLSAGARPMGTKGETPTVSDDILDAYRTAESQSRTAGEGVRSAAADVRASMAGTPQREEAMQRLQMAQAGEQQASKAAEDAWLQIPASVRNNYSHEAEAIRSDMAGDSPEGWPRTFAEEQLNGEKQLVNDKIKDSLNSVQTEQKNLTSQQAADLLHRQLDDAQELSRNIRSRLWQRAPLQAQMPSRSGPNQDLNDFVADMAKRFDPENPQQVPKAAIQRMYKMFSTTTADGEPQPLPTLNRVQGEVNALDAERRSAMANNTGSRELYSNLANLEGLAHKWMGDAFPDNVPLQQARSYSKFYHDIWTHSDLAQFMQVNGAGKDLVRPEDTLTALFKSPHAMGDMYEMTDRLLGLPAIRPTAKITGTVEMQPGEESTMERLRNFPGITDALARHWASIDPQPSISPTMPGTLKAQVTGGMDMTQKDSLYGGHSMAQRDTLLDPTQKATLENLQETMADGIRTQFQEQLGQERSTMRNGEPIPDNEVAGHMQKTMQAWEPKIQAFSKVAGEIQGTMQAAMAGVARRKQIEDSSLNKYLESGDAQKAIDKVWTSQDPAAYARALISGEAGIGGFSKDPIAMEGFRSAIVDRLLKASSSSGQLDPGKLSRNIANGQNQRLLKTVLGDDRLSRLERLTTISNTLLSRGKHSIFAEAIILGGRIAATHINALLPHIGEGGEMQRASIFSEIAKDSLGRVLATTVNSKNPTAALEEAIRNPSFERLMYTHIAKPLDAIAMRHNLLAARRVLRYGAAMDVTYNAVMNNPNGNGPVDHRPALGDNLSTLGAP